jgi:hypothetical protein
MPESPRFLVSVKRYDEAREIFKWIGKKNGISKDDVEERLKEINFEGEEYR